METVCRVIGGVVGVALVVWGSLPALIGLFGVGSLALVVAGGLCLLISLAYPSVALLVQKIGRHAVGKGVLIGIAAVIAALLLLFVVVSVLMIGAASHTPSEEATVVVLGAGLYEERPSRILSGRLDAAVEYLKAHPQAACIVSGGQGEDEVCTEASVMQRYLLNAGIEAERIYLEDRSTSTYENIRFSQTIIEENGLNPALAVVTQEFHQYRAQQFAAAAGFSEVGAVTAHTPWYLLGSYWVRDFAGICHMVLLGN